MNEADSASTTWRAMDPELQQFFGLVCDKIASHPTYSVKLAEAASAGEQLFLNYHTHGPDQAYCASVCVRRRTPAEPGQPLEELAHIRGIGARGEDCGPRMAAFAALLVERYGLKQPPIVFLDGAPFAGR
jgi:hypothetical protein